EVILKVLADNGHNFSKLDEKESLTVSVTFRAAAPVAHGVGFADFDGDGFLDLYIANRLSKPDKAPENEGKGKGDTKPPAEPKKAPEKANSSANDLELLGDLHLKQKRFQDAIKAYEKAVELNPEAKALYRKLVQAHLLLEEGAKEGSQE